jgi:hypothetical protein
MHLRIAMPLQLLVCVQLVVKKLVTALGCLGERQALRLNLLSS